MTTTDPTCEPSRWQPLRELLATLDAEIEEVYRERGIHGIRARFASPIIRLSHTGPLTIRELATSLGRSHSAMSQTVTAMRRENLVESEPGEDGRTRRVTLTERAQNLVPFVEAEWRATEEAVVELDNEVPYALSTVVVDLERALQRRRMRERVVDHLLEPGVRSESSQRQR